MNRWRLSITYLGDRYEVRLDGDEIYSIEKIYSDSRMVRQMNYSNLPAVVRREIIKQILNERNHETE